MEVKKIVEGMTAPQVAQVIDDNFKAQNKILGDDIATQNSVIGVSEYKDFSEAEAVAVGDVRKYNGYLYECVEATTGAWDASKWKKSSFKAETEKKLSELGSKVGDVSVNFSVGLSDKHSSLIDKIFIDGKSGDIVDLTTISSDGNTSVIVQYFGYKSSEDGALIANGSLGSTVSVVLNENYDSIGVYIPKYANAEVVFSAKFALKKGLESQSNKIKGLEENLGVKTSKYNVSVGRDHSSLYDRIVTDIKKGDEFIVDVNFGDTGLSHGTLFAEIEGFNDFLSLGIIYGKKLFKASDNIKSLGLYTPVAASSGEVLFSVVHGGVAEVVRENNKIVNSLYSLSFEGKDDVYSKGSNIYNLVRGRTYRVICDNNQWDISGYSGAVYVLDIEGQNTDDSLEVIKGFKGGENIPKYFDITIAKEYNNVYIGGRAKEGTIVKFSVIDITDADNAIKQIDEIKKSLTNDAIYHNSGIFVVEGQNNKGIQKNFQCKVGHKYEVELPKDWMVSNTVQSNYIFAVGYYDGSNYIDFHHKGKHDGVRKYEFTAIDEAVFYYLFLRADIGETVKVSITDISAMDIVDNKNRTYVGEKISLNTFSMKKMFRLSDIGVPSIAIDSQGMDVYGNKYLFQGNDASSTGEKGIYIIDLEKKELVGDFEFTGYEYFHFNTICCGEKYNEDDRFPLLYLTQMKEDYKCVVVRIADDGKSYSEIQTITYQGEHYIGSLGYNYLVDTANSNIYIFGLPSNQVDARCEITKFALPDINEKSVTLMDDGILDNFIVEDCNILQGAKVIGNKIYAPFGWGIHIDENSPSQIKVIDLHEKKVVSVVDVREIGEAEDVALYNGGLITLNNSTNPTYYLLKF